MGGLTRRAAWTIGLVAVLGTIDAALTLRGVREGLFRELNPLLGLALEAHVGWFLVLKGALTLLWAGVVIRERRRDWVVDSGLGIAAGYGVIVARSLWALLV